MEKVSPFNHYVITTESVLSAKQRREYITALHEKGWIHPNTFNYKRKAPNKEFELLEISCTAEHLGRVTSFLLERENWLIVELVNSNHGRRK